MIHSPMPRFLVVLLFLLMVPIPREGRAQEEAPTPAVDDPFPMLAGLESAVEFWKLVFTRYSYHELIFHDPTDPAKIYKVVRAEEGSPSGALVDAERRKLLEEHALAESDNRLRIQRGVKERFAVGLTRSRRYLEQMRQIFREEGVPADLIYLPLVESSFNVHARSRVGAVGMWQFMPKTGKRFLRVGRIIDERKDPLASTRAAARYLKENYRLLGNWPLAITAYNHGGEGILRGVREVGSRDLTEIIKNYQGPAFGFASRNFYAEFLAAVEVAKRGEEFFPNLEYHSPWSLEELELKKAVSVSALLKHASVSRSEFLEWNPALNLSLQQIPTWYRVKVPAEKSELFYVAYRRAVGLPSVQLVSASTQKKTDSWVHHRVAQGETLSELAKQYGTSVYEIQKLNGLARSSLIGTGQNLKIPKR